MSEAKKEMRTMLTTEQLRQFRELAEAYAPAESISVPREVMLALLDEIEAAMSEATEKRAHDDAQFEAWAIAEGLAFRDQNGLWPMAGAEIGRLRAAWIASRAEALEEAAQSFEKVFALSDDLAVGYVAEAIRALAKEGD